VTDPLTLLAELAPDLVHAIEQLVDERVDARLAREGTTPKRWLSVPEAGEYLGCSSKAVYARIDRGRIPGSAVRRMGRTVTIDRLALDRTLDH
jgi:excisionase family DNA binding protein